jgi:RNA polymerase sigma-70 factor (ECF subfamily)
MDDLIAGLKKKEETALKKVMSLYKNKIYNYLRVLVSSDEIAEELTQDTFVKVYFKAHTLRTNNLKAWIYTIATNLARSQFRKNKIKYLFSLADVNEGYLSVNPDSEDHLLLEQLIAKLPEKYRVPLVMKEIDNFSFEEISGMLDKPVGTVKTLVFRGKNRLRAHLNGSANPLKNEFKGGNSQNATGRGLIKASFNR